MLTLLDKLHKQLFPNVDLMEVSGTGKQRFRTEIAYKNLELLRPHPSDSRFEYNILGMDWLLRNQVNLRLSHMTLSIQPQEQVLAR